MEEREGGHKYHRRLFDVEYRRTFTIHFETGEDGTAGHLPIVFKKTSPLRCLSPTSVPVHMSSILNDLFPDREPTKNWFFLYRFFLKPQRKCVHEDNRTPCWRFYINDVVCTELIIIQ